MFVILPHNYNYMTTAINRIKLQLKIIPLCRVDVDLNKIPTFTNSEDPILSSTKLLLMQRMI
jgi:hypothetical protein